MDIGIIGLGRMGAGMARRWLRHGHRVVVNNRSHDPIRELEKDGAVGAYDLQALVAALPAPRAIWIMLPSGNTTEQMIENLVPLLSPGDTIIDSGNTNFNDDLRRAPILAAKGINYIDQGTSGGIWGLELGFCLMVGGEPAVVKRLEQAFIDLAPKDGYLHCGPVGSGHFVKMVHNGVEYGMMQAYAEGFEIMQARKDFNLDMHAISKVWNHGSVVRSWLLELAEPASQQDPKLDQLIEAQGKEINPEKRKAILLDIQRMILDNMYLMSIRGNTTTTLLWPYTQGYSTNGDRAGRFYRSMWLDTDAPGWAQRPADARN